MIDNLTQIKARMKVQVDCVGLPHKKFPEKMVVSAEYVRHETKRKKRWNVWLQGLYMN